MTRHSRTKIVIRRDPRPLLEAGRWTIDCLSCNRGWRRATHAAAVQRAHDHLTRHHGTTS